LLGELRVSYRFPWYRLADEHLLDLRICDLALKIKGSFLEPHIKRLYSELNDRGIRFKPHVWLSEEWFSPDGVPGIAIPFYLAHSRLMKLERKQMNACVFFGTKLVTLSTLLFGSTSKRAGASCSAPLRNAIRISISQSQRVETMYCICAPGMPRPIRQKTSQKRLLFGCSHVRAGAGVTKVGPLYENSNTLTS